MTTARRALAFAPLMTRLSALAAAAVLVACSSSPSSGIGNGNGNGDAGSDGSTGGVPGQCPPPGTKANEKGYGASCTPGGGECDGSDAGLRLCPPDFFPTTPASGWFCTFQCSADADCGSGEVCAHTRQGAGCMPTICVAANCPGGFVDGGCNTGDAGP